MSQEDFLQVNNIRQKANKYGVPHQSEIEALPLKVFMKCNDCNKGYTGYIVKKKNLYYYKCRTKGCHCNKNAKDLNNSFEQFLERYKIKEDFIPHLYKIMGEKFGSLNETNSQQKVILENQLSELQKKIDNMEESYYITKEMSEETFKKFKAKFCDEKGKILDAMQDCGKDCSNHSDYYISALQFSRKLATVWASSHVSIKEKIQETIFPKGIVYDYKKGAFRTEITNKIFEHVADVVKVSEENKTGQPEDILKLSSQVDLN